MVKRSKGLRCACSLDSASRRAALSSACTRLSRGANDGAVIGRLEASREMTESFRDFCAHTLSRRMPSALTYRGKSGMLQEFLASSCRSGSRALVGPSSLWCKIWVLRSYTFRLSTRALAKFWDARAGRRTARHMEISCFSCLSYGGYNRPLKLIRNGLDRLKRRLAATCVLGRSLKDDGQRTTRLARRTQF